MHNIARNLVSAYPYKIEQGMVPFVVSGTFKYTVLAHTSESAKIEAMNDMENWDQVVDSFEYLSAEKVDINNQEDDNE